MASMTDERRKEMEEEMMRFEQEIAFPNDDDPPGKSSKPPGSLKGGTECDAIKEKKPTPTTNTVPKVLSKAPPPPPPPPPPPFELMNVHRQQPPPQQRPLRPPPMPPMQGQQVAHMQFIPHQLQRQPPRPPRPNLIPVRGPPGFHGPGPMPFPMHGALLPPMHPHHMALHPMGVPLTGPPGFCPPPPGLTVGPIPNMPMNMPPQPFIPAPMPVPYQEPPTSPAEREAPASKESKSEPDIASAPAVYAAPPMKSQSDRVVESSVVTNGQPIVSATVQTPVNQNSEEQKPNKTVEDAVTAINIHVPALSEPVISKKEKKKKKSVRMAGGQAWEDNSLLDWDPDDFRIFCGDLGNDVTDEVLIRAFSKYQSFVKAKVIRDKRTNKTKGYGFVSFKDPQDFIKAMREMNGRYVGSRPIKLRKSTWRDRNIEIVRKKQKEKEKLGLL